MSEHLHSTFIPGCFRCELGLDEVRADGQITIRAADSTALMAPTPKVSEDRTEQIRELLEAKERHFQSNGFGLSKDEYAQWIKDGAAAFALHRDGADYLAYLLDALAAAREENERLREALEVLFPAAQNAVDGDNPFLRQQLNTLAAAISQARTTLVERSHR